MKKIMLFAAAALVGATFADGVASDVVGYNTITIHPGWNMFAVNYDGVSGSTGIKVNDLLPTAGLAAGNNAGSGDMINVWKEDGSGDYDSYFLYYTTKAKFTSANNTWVQSAGTTTDDTLLPGRCFWYYSRNANDVTVSFAGKVPFSATSRQINIVTGWNMIGNPFSSGFALNDSSWGTYWKDRVDAGQALAGNNAGSGDMINVWKEDGSGDYDSYFLYYTTKAKFTSANYTWVQSAGTTFDGDMANLGLGMYYYCRGTGFQLQMPRPYSAE